MASHKSAEKCIRKIARRTAINRSRLSRIRTFIKKAEEVLVKDDSVEIKKDAVVAAEREIMRGVRKGVLHRNTAARKISKLARKVK